MHISPHLAHRNIRLQSWINFLSGIVFLIPIITLFYQYVGLSIPEIILITNVSTLTVWLFELPTSVFADTTGRKRSLVISVVCNFLSACCILLFPSLIGFIVAAIFSGLYFAFWSGTGQAFLEENLRICGEEKQFGKYIGHLMSLEQLAGLITPLIVSGILKIFDTRGYPILALLDAISAGCLVILTAQLREVHVVQKIHSIREAIAKNIIVAKSALHNVFFNPNLRLLLTYRSLANHVAFFFVISLPLRVEDGMAPWMAGIFGTLGAIGIMFAQKFAYKFADKTSYNVIWVFSTIAQAILLIIAGIFVQSWITITIVGIVFSFFEGLWMPAWNHVLVGQTRGIAIATTRSVIFGVFALYTTLGKQFLSLFPISYSLIGIGVFILVVNAFLARRMLQIK